MSQLQTHKIITIGQLGRPHGVKGMQKMQVFGGENIDLRKNTSWLIKGKSEDWRPIKAETVEVKSGYVLVKLEGVNDRDAAKALTNKEVGISASQLPQLPEGEFYWNELIGLKVINKAGITLGKVVDLMETGSNDVLVIESEKGEEQLIPYLPDDCVLDVDLKARQMTVDWDEDF